MKNIFSGIVALILILGILPSSAAIGSPSTGPLNIIKLALPLFAIFLFIQKKQLLKDFGQKFLLISGAAVAIALIGSLTGAMGCESKSEIYRNFFALSAGVISAFSFFALDTKWRTRVVWGWLSIIIFAIVIDEFFPQVVEFLNMKVFDPESHNRDNAEMMTKVLSGIFSRHVFARFLALIPLLFLIFNFKKWPPLINALALATASGLVLRTTQRGAYLGLCVGLLIYLLHIHAKKFLTRKTLLALVLSGLALVSSAKLFLPQAVIEGRLLPTLQPQTLLDYKKKNQTNLEQDSRTNAAYRVLAWSQSFKSILHHPFGYACPSQDEFFVLGAQPKHSHNMFIEQMRSRGWLWGFVFLAIWIFALWKSFKNFSYTGSLIFMAVTASTFIGIFDDPLRTIGQNIIFAVILLCPFSNKGSPT